MSKLLFDRQTVHEGDERESRSSGDLKIAHIFSTVYITQIY